MASVLAVRVRSSTLIAVARVAIHVSLVIQLTSARPVLLSSLLVTRSAFSANQINILKETHVKSVAMTVWRVKADLISVDSAAKIQI